MDRPSGMTIAAVVAVLIALWLLLMREAWRAWQPARLLLKGRYADARAAAERLERSWMRVFPSVRLSSRYVIGCALHLEGDLEGSLAALTPLHSDARLRGNMRDVVGAIEAASLLLLGRDHARAAALLAAAAHAHRSPEDLLLEAHASQGLGQRDAAEQRFAEAGTEHRFTTGIRLGTLLVMEDRAQQEAIFHALRGLYLVQAGRPLDAQRDLEIAARSPITNVYVERSRAALRRAALETDDPRSSLAPQVIARRSDGDA